ncbi:MAG: hypothetical protein RMM53_06340 [Bacteroidia bacterium]|nr:hypothetical protein [Bacteroidia bacterium]MDW8333815.1 hypothetical protein [Bacteroidia bacterium]
MKKWLVCAPAFLSIGAAWAQSFEGTAVGSYQSGREYGNVEWIIKKNVSVASGTAVYPDRTVEYSLYIDLDAPYFDWYIPAQKVAYRFEKASVKSYSGGGRFVPTGEMEERMGRLCRKFMAQDEEKRYVVWLANLDFDAAAYGDFLKHPPYPEGVKGFPVEIRIEDLSGNPTYHLKIHELKSRPVSDEALRLPPGTDVRELTKK